jgi:hypothetical protein
VLLAALTPALTQAAGGEVHPVLDLETGAVWASRNDVRVPGDTGVTFSLAGGDFQSAVAPFVRVRAGATFGRHGLWFTFAPLRLSGPGRSQAAVVFRDLTFVADGDATARYRFDTYRLTYRYALVSGRAVDLQLGATALLRDAEISLSRAGLSTAERNTGLVPLLSFRVAWRFAGPFALSLDGDALAAPQGRAEDVALALEFTSGDLTFRAGYRVLEGGADNDKVFNFAWLNHAMVGASYAL